VTCIGSLDDFFVIYGRRAFEEPGSWSGGVLGLLPFSRLLSLASRVHPASFHIIFIVVIENVLQISAPGENAGIGTQIKEAFEILFELL
jgi:hypothetical protein